jgi:hypothetical protein
VDTEAGWQGRFDAGGIGRRIAQVVPQARFSTHQGFSRGPVRVCASVAAPPKEEKMVAAPPQVRTLQAIYIYFFDPWKAAMGGCL